MEAAQHIAIVDHRDVRDLVGKYLRQSYRVSVADSTAALRWLLNLRVGRTAAGFDRAVDNQMSLPAELLFLPVWVNPHRVRASSPAAPVRLLPLKGRTKPTQTVPNILLSHPRSRW